jgi:ubiquinone/menaquinone biosynthesis C-methylase UbiE
MIEVAQDTLKKTPVSTGQYEYIQGSAESLPFLEDSSVDLIIAGACVKQYKLDGTVCS